MSLERAKAKKIDLRSINPKEILKIATSDALIFLMLFSGCSKTQEKVENKDIIYNPQIAIEENILETAGGDVKEIETVEVLLETDVDNSKVRAVSENNIIADSKEEVLSLDQVENKDNLEEKVVINTKGIIINKEQLENFEESLGGIQVAKKDLRNYTGSITILLDDLDLSTEDFSYLSYLENASEIKVEIKQYYEEMLEFFKYINNLNKVVIKIDSLDMDSSNLEQIMTNIKNQMGINNPDEYVFLPITNISLDKTKLKKYVNIDESNYIHNGYYVTKEALLNYSGEVTCYLEYANVDLSFLEYLENADVNIEMYSNFKEIFNGINSNNNIDNYIIEVWHNDISIEDLNYIIENSPAYNDIIVNYTAVLNSEDEAKEFSKFINNIKYKDNVKVNLDFLFAQAFNYNEMDFNANLNDIKISFNEIAHYDLNENSLDFLGKIPQSKNITIKMDNYNVDYDLRWLDKYNLENLNLEFGVTQEFNVDFKKIAEIKNLKSIKLIGYSYDIAVYLTDEIKDLFEQNGIEIKYSDSVDLNKVKEANDKINQIISELNLEENATVSEKYNAIIAYILKNYQYDEEIGNILDNNGDSSELTQAKYTDGNLDAVINGNGDIICGNYAALFESLANRLGIDSMMAFSHNHAWNIVKLDNEYYYVDTCWLDGENELYFIELLEENKTEELENFYWYKYSMEDYYEGKIQDDNTHKLTLLPNIDIDIDLKEESNYEEFDMANITKAIDITGNKYKIIINNKQYIVTANLIMGMLLGANIAKNVTKYIKERDNILSK